MGVNPEAWVALGYVVIAMAVTALQGLLLGAVLALRGAVALRTGRRWSVWVVFWPPAALGLVVAGLAAADDAALGPLVAIASACVVALFGVSAAAAVRVRLARSGVLALAVVVGLVAVWLLRPLLSLAL